MNLPDSDKRRLSNKRTKVLAKINKVNSALKRYEKDKAALAKEGKVVREVVKVYPFEAEGTLSNYRLISEAFQSLPEHPD